MRRLSVALTGEIDTQLADHLLRIDGQEDLCFALYRPSAGARRDTCLLGEPILPREHERAVHGNASFTGEYFLRAAEQAERAGAGLALAHSHPGGRRWQDMSHDDVQAETRYAAQALALTGLPLLGLTLAGDRAWSARRWQKTGPGVYARADGESVRVIAERLAITHNPNLCPPPPADERMTRTISSWGADTQQSLARQHVGIIGAGSVGALVGEALARTGVHHITIIDFDTVKTHNLDRLANATRLDVLRRRSKAQVLRDALVRYGTAPDLRVSAHELSIVEPDGYHAALDCDVLFSCVDRPWPRQLLDHIAYAHLIPVVDGGIAIRARPRLTSADWKAHIAAPGRPCLECLGQYLPAEVSLERTGDLDDPAYIQTLPDDHPHRANENVYAFSMACASLEILQWLSMSVAPLDIADVGAWNFHFVTGSLDQTRPRCKPGCLKQDILAAGDHAKPTEPTDEHPASYRETADRIRAQGRPSLRALERTLRYQARLATVAQRLLARALPPARDDLA
jgi:molybdopterin-synthase adenylyltransferase